MAELEAYEVLARIYDKSDEPLYALEYAILAGSQKLVKELAPQISIWPEFLPELVVSRAPWVRRTAVVALEHVGDVAPLKWHAISSRNS